MRPPLHKAGIVSKSEPEKILFKSFTNKQRVVFLLKLIKNFSEANKPGEIIDFNLKRNHNAKLEPDDPEIKWLDEAIENIKIDGTKLNNIPLLSNDKYYNYYFILKVIIKYTYDIGPNTGTCQISYFFQTNTSKILEESDFVFSLDRVTPKGRISDDELLKLKAKISGLARAMAENAKNEVLKI